MSWPVVYKDKNVSEINKLHSMPYIIVNKSVGLKEDLWVSRPLWKRTRRRRRRKTWSQWASMEVIFLSEKHSQSEILIRLTVKCLALIWQCWEPLLETSVRFFWGIIAVLNAVTRLNNWRSAFIKVHFSSIKLSLRAQWQAGWLADLRLKAYCTAWFHCTISNSHSWCD